MLRSENGGRWSLQEHETGLLTNTSFLGSKPESTRTRAINPKAKRARARTPGSTDVGEALDQIKDASDALKTLQSEWSSYACVDKEGRACNVDAARKVLGGVAPQRGDAAIEVAKRTPLYRIDGAFAAVRRYALEGDAAWADALDVEAFVEKGEEIAFALKKADDGFYGVVFASKGSTQLDKIYAEGKQSVDLAVRDFDQILTMLREAKAPGL